MAPNPATVYSAWGALESRIRHEWQELHLARRLVELDQRANPERHAYALRQLLLVRRIGKRIGLEYEGWV